MLYKYCSKLHFRTFIQSVIKNCQKFQTIFPYSPLITIRKNIISKCNSINVDSKLYRFKFKIDDKINFKEIRIITIKFICILYVNLQAY